MIDETISRLEEKLQRSTAMNEQTRQELLSLLATLKTEASALSRTHAQEAQRIVGLTQASTNEATQQNRDSERLAGSLADLSASVDGFEKSHPQLVHLVNRISEILANLGI